MDLWVDEEEKMVYNMGMSGKRGEGEKEEELQFNAALEACGKGDFGAALSLLKELLERQLDNKQVLFALSCINFWQDALDATAKFDNDFERGGHLLSHWELFTKGLVDGQRKKRGFVCPFTVDAARRGVFSRALLYFKGANSDDASSVLVKRNMGFCYKRLGDYEAALEVLMSANALAQSRDAAVMAELADSYSLCGDEKSAKLLFREAFFIDAQSVDLSMLDSKLIWDLKVKIEGLGITGVVLKEWMPVYGAVYGVFCVRRVLRAAEVGSLKQRIFTLENDLKDPRNPPAELVPRLVNAYLWLIDYYTDAGDSDERIAELLLKIKLQAPEVYNLCAR